MKLKLVRAGALGVGIPVAAVGYREHNRCFPHRRAGLKLRSVDDVLATPLTSTSTRIYRALRPAIFFLTPDPELAHSGAVAVGQLLTMFWSVADKVKTVSHCLTVGFANMLVGRSRHRQPATQASRLSIEVNGTVFELPVGVSAGFDKNGKLAGFFGKARDRGVLQAGHAEIGSVSYSAWEGNTKPRLFRLPADRAIINRMGLNNDGAEAVANRLSGSGKLRRIGVNITKTPDAKIEGAEAVEDFVKSFEFMRFIDGVDWVTLNISCPNTAEGKTFEDPSALADLLGHLPQDGKPVFLKLAPPPDEATMESGRGDGVFETAAKFGIKTLIIANTVPDRNFELKSHPQLLGERGGLSGPPIFGRSTPLIKEAFKRGFTVVGVGGVSSGKDAYELVKNGASLIQLYTAMVYDGPGVFADIHNGLERCLVIDGFDKIGEAVGVDVARKNVY